MLDAETASNDGFAAICRSLRGVITTVAPDVSYAALLATLSVHAREVDIDTRTLVRDLKRTHKS